MGASVGGKGRFVAEINVTPFVDVMLVLLIIFMVTAPLMTTGLDVDLPQTKAAKSLPTDKDHVVLTVKRDGDGYGIYLDTYKVQDVADLEVKLAVVAKEQKRQVFLQADKDVPYGIVVDIVGRIKAAGIDKMGMVAEELAPAAQNSVPMQGAGRSGR